jgi:fructose-1,6-bisphosphatase II
MAVSRTPQQPDRNLAMELVRTTESAALAASRWVGRGAKNGADGAAVEAMRTVLANVPMDGIVVIGEGEKDEAPMLFNGELVGDGTQPMTDVAVDPIDGTTLTSLGRGNALSVIAVSERGTMFDPGPCVYMTKIAVGPDAAGSIDITATATQNLRWIAKAKRENVRDLTVAILDRPRHEELVEEVRTAGARIKLISDGDVAGAIAAASAGTGVDVLIGIGGAPEAVVAATAIKTLGGNMQCRLVARNEAERAQAEANGADLSRVLTLNDLVRSDDVYFAATGITDGELLQGVHFRGGDATTESIVMRGRTGTIRRISAQHRREKLMRLLHMAFGDPPLDGDC